VENLDGCRTCSNPELGRIVHLAVADGQRIRTAPAADRAGEARFDVRQPHVVGPAVGAEGTEWLKMEAARHTAPDVCRA
jgi:hypothetical protein